MQHHSITEENYLKAIYKHSQGTDSVSTNTIARELSTAPASVTDMLKRLSEKKLVIYRPYKGVQLSEQGGKIALTIIRKHRLWEVFLVNILNFSWDSVHDTAEQLEHINSPELIDKLDEFLGYPKFDPHGDPIPSKTGEIILRPTINLSECPVGVAVSVAGVGEDSKDFLQYLDRMKMNIGSKILVVEKIEFDSSLILQVGEREVVLSGEFAKRIEVLES